MGKCAKVVHRPPAAFIWRVGCRKDHRPCDCAFAPPECDRFLLNVRMVFHRKCPNQKYTAMMIIALHCVEQIWLVKATVIYITSHMFIPRGVVSENARVLLSLLPSTGKSISTYNMRLEDSGLIESRAVGPRLNCTNIFPSSSCDNSNTSSGKDRLYAMSHSGNSISVVCAECSRSR